MSDTASTHHCEHCSSHDGNGLTAGFLLGLVIGSIATYVLVAPDGKKQAKTALKKSVNFLEDLEEQTADTRAALQEAFGENISKTLLHFTPDKSEDDSFADRMKKRFFRKNGRTLTA